MERFNEINIAHSAYPLLLKEIAAPPKKIYFLGELPPENMTRIAIVGTRKASFFGRKFAKELAKKLTELNIVVVSGLAMGIDAAAHEGAVEANGKTIAVLANGLNKIYPAQNENLARKIIDLGGAIISEYPAGTEAFKNNFLERNRIVSGLSVATIVIEAPERSGSLVTARLAAEQGREVFVVPGSIDNPNYRGSHQLIRDGARLIASMKDVLEDLGINQKLNIKNQNDKSKLKNVADKNQLLVLKTIQEVGQPLNIDEIIKFTKLKPQTANQAIAILVVEEIIKETEKGYAI